MDATAKPLPAAPDAEGMLILRSVERMQRDGRLLLRHIAGRADRALPSPGEVAEAQPAKPSPLETLYVDSATLARSPAQLDRLARCLDALTREAAPATAASVRLTRAYLRRDKQNSDQPDDDVVPEEVKLRASRLRWVLKGLAFATMFVVLFTLALLAHVDDGRRSLVQLQAVRAELRATYDELVRLPDTAWVGQKAPEGALPPRFAHVCGTGSDGGRIPAATPEGARANGLCNSAYEGGLRLDLVLLRIEGWNCRTRTPWAWPAGRCPPQWPIYQPKAETPGTTAAAPSTPGVVKPQPAPPSSPTPTDWSRTEMRIEATIATLSGFFLPLLTGFIGGVAYVLRRLDHKLSQSTLEPRDGWHAVLRVLLAMTLGGLIGVVWSGDTVSLGGVNLTLAAAAFFVGFALEAVFTLIEAMVESVAGRLRGEPGPPARAGG